MCKTLQRQFALLVFLAVSALSAGVTPLREARAGFGIATESGFGPSISLTWPGGGVMPLTTDMTGIVNGEAGAGATAAGAVLFEKMPSAGLSWFTGNWNFDRSG